MLFPASTVMSGSADEWALTMQVNVLGVVNTLQAFVPAMVARAQPCAVVVTASVAGLISGMAGPYGVSKHAAVATAEAFHNELASTPGAEHVHLHVLCPGLVNTGLMYLPLPQIPLWIRYALKSVALWVVPRYSSNEMTEARDDIDGAIDGTKARRGDSSSAEGVEGFAPERWAAAMTPELIGRRVFEGISSGEFYIIVGGDSEAAQAGMKAYVKTRHDGASQRSRLVMVVTACGAADCWTSHY